MKTRILTFGVSLFLFTTVYGAGVERMKFSSGSFSTLMEKSEEAIHSDRSYKRGENFRSHFQRHCSLSDSTYADSTHRNGRMVRVLQAVGYGIIGIQFSLIPAMFLFPRKGLLFVLLSSGCLGLWWSAFFLISKKGDRRRWFPFMMGITFLFLAIIGIYFFFTLPYLAEGTAGSSFSILTWVTYFFGFILLLLLAALLFSFLFGLSPITIVMHRRNESFHIKRKT